jgi:hypothetical protein
MDYTAGSNEPQEPTTDVLVDTVRATHAGSTVALGEGIRECDGRPVSFAADWRPMLELAQAIRDTGPPQTARIPSWAILTVAPRSAA